MQRPAARTVINRPYGVDGSILHRVNPLGYRQLLRDGVPVPCDETNRI